MKGDLPERFVFIVTYGRSGSTLLQNLLNTLPGYQIRGENENTTLHLAQAWGVLRFSDQVNGRRRAGTKSDQTSPWYGAERIEADAYGVALAESFVRNVLRPSEGVRVSGFKEIRYHLHPKGFWRHLNFLASCFPDAKFIFNTRNHDDVAQSGWWRDRDPTEVDEVLTAAERLYADYAARFPARCHSLHYDDYVADPRTLRGLFDFLGEPYDAKLVDDVMAMRLKHLHGPDAAHATGDAGV